MRAEFPGQWNKPAAKPMVAVVRINGFKIIFMRPLLPGLFERC
jgi:hypothetical protein